ncbi:hypothetical protein ABL78_5174 [Leptomonas seymouri]|uniref:Uncharacterized protein n=1 Tax=Leptomonas seymouri TaxID=5684 RepID=A0A0N0P4W1_LEPSE|nr:hypothetical protein ABL78_5174 [Leptomonas seymouri]|eukprot:KPI85756.1 hypothetical protein ABL78_5174 [Leptomonas seymouri]
MPLFFKKKREHESGRQKRNTWSSEENNLKVQVTGTSSEGKCTCPSDSVIEEAMGSGAGHQIAPLCIQSPNSPNKSFRSDRTTGKPECDSDKDECEYHGNQAFSVPRLKRNSGPSSSWTMGSSSNGSGDAATFPTLVNASEGEQHTTRGGAAAMGSTRGRSSPKVLLPHLTPMQSSSVGKVLPASPSAPTSNSAPSLLSKPPPANASFGINDGADLTQTKRYSASGPVPASQQLLQKPLAEIHCRSAREAGSGASLDGHSASSDIQNPATRTATDAHTPESGRVKAAAEISSSTPTSAASIQNAPTPVFSAMEAVPKNSGVTRRRQGFRKGIAKDASALPSDSASNTNRGSGGTSVAGGAVAAVPVPPPQPSLLSATYKDRVASGGGGSAHGRHREPVAGFAEEYDKPLQRLSAKDSPGLFNVPLPPPMAADELALCVNKSPHRSRSHRSGSVQSISGSVDRDALDQTPSAQRSRRSSLRLQTPHSTTSQRSINLSSNDGTPHPLTRHASTLSNGQREALKRTPSFLSRVHTPPLSEFRESVHLRVRRSSLSEGPPSDPQPISTSRTKGDASFTSDSVMNSGVFSSHSEGRRTAESARGVTNSSAISSVTSAPVRSTSHTPRSPVASMPDIQSSALPPTPTGGGDSARFSNHRRRLDHAQRSGSPLPTSPEPAAENKKDAEHLSGAPQVLSMASSDQANNTESNASVFSNETELFDYYGSFILAAPQFNPSADSRLTSPPPPEKAAVARTAATPPAKVGADAALHTPKPDIDAKKGRASDSPSKEPTDHGDALPYKSAPPELTRASETGTSATPPAHASPSSSPDRVRAVCPASRQRLINAYLDEDDDIYQLAKGVVGGSGGSADNTKPACADMGTSSSAYDYLMDCETLKDAAAATTPSSSKEPTQTSSLEPAKRLVSQQKLTDALIAAHTNVPKQSSSDEEDDDEDDDADDLLEGFRPPFLDAIRNRRRGSNILFYLGEEDSLSSLDVVIKPGSGGSGTATVIGLPSAYARPQSGHASPKNDASARLCGAPAKGAASETAMRRGSLAAEAVARPRVTIEPYVPLDTYRLSGPPPTLPTPPTMNSAGSRMDSGVSKSPSLLQDPYNLQLDSSDASLPASASRLTKITSASRTALGRPAPLAPASIFHGTSSRFAPDPSKMYRPIPNTFGYSKGQRRARAAKMAAGTELEAWEDAASTDDGNLYREVYTDENGDEWYWEEVEEGEEGEDEEDEEYQEEASEREEDEDIGGEGKPAGYTAPNPAAAATMTTA